MIKKALALSVLLLALPDIVRAQQSDSLPITFDAKVLEQQAAQIQGNSVPALGFTIIHRGQPRVLKTWGTTQLGQGGTPVNNSTVFRWASLSKSVASTAAALAVKEGALDWMTPTHTLLPYAKLSSEQATRSLNLFNILSQQTGIESYNYGDQSLQQGATRHQLNEMLGRAKLKCMPGANCYSYQNAAYQWAGDMIAASTRQPFERYVSGNVFKPLNMTTASYGLEGLKNSSSWARPHVGTRIVDPKPTYYLLPAAAGVNGSITDLARWLSAQSGYRQDIIPTNMLNDIQSPRVRVPDYSSGWRKQNIQSNWYGMGWRVWVYKGEIVVTHSGAVEGYRATVAIIPSKHLAVGVLWNSQSSEPAKLIPATLDAALGHNIHTLPNAPLIQTQQQQQQTNQSPHIEEF